MFENRGGFFQSLSRAIKKRDFIYKFICIVMIKMGFSNMELQALEIRNKKFRKIEKKYRKYISHKNYSINKDTSVSDDVWICWFQGIDTAPEIVKSCIRSIKKHMKNKKIHIITEANMNDYVEIPEYILQKWKEKRISYAHLSDILRTELLIKYGGFWIDATTFMSGEIPEYVTKKPLFLLNFKTREDLTIPKNSWFIYSQPNNRTLLITRDLLYEYWKKENHLSEYFLWHMFVKMALDKYPEDHKNIDYVSEEMSHMLLYNFFEKYNEDYWKQIKRFSNIHKLSYYKFFTEDTKMPKNVKDTFYEYFIEGKLK